jgi:phosphate acetyltransferase
MAERGQIRGALVDGPLALDNAISPQAAIIKKLASLVAGRANVLVVPDLEAGNMLAKKTCHFWLRPMLPESCSARACRLF